MTAYICFVKSFLMFKATSTALLMATLVLAILKPPREEARTHARPPDGKIRVSFDEVRIGGIARCRVRHDDSLGTEFMASAWGSERARVAMDGSRYWFWIRDYDSRSHYECPPELVEGTDLIPPLRPSFLIWVLNDRRPGDPLKFSDGDYEVELKLMDGSVAEQTYSRHGVVEARATVEAFQESSGRKFPALAILEMNGESIKIDMGAAETTSPTAPDTAPPNWSAAKKIEP